MRLLLTGLILSAISFSASDLALADTVEFSGERIGRWCDTAIPNSPEYDYIIEIWKSKDGSYSYHQLLKSKTSKPSINSYPANKINQTWHVQNDHGEYVRVGDDGFLRLYDGLGFIRKAIPVGPDTKPGECRNNNKKYN